MTLKEKIMAIKSYEEFDKRREEFKDLKPDKEILAHLSEIFPKAYAGKEELRPRN